MILPGTPSNRLKRIFFEAYFIKQLNASFNYQLDSEILILFGDGVTYLYNGF